MAIQITHTPLRIPDILLPNNTIDLYKWAVIACDQFTSAPNYWDEVNNIVGNSPSTLKLILPEIYLESNDLQERLQSINKKSKQYIDEDIFSTFENCMMIIKRQSPRVSDRWGIVLQIDLSKYDPNPEIENPIKATEAIVQSRLPKRIAMRKHSLLDLSHVLMLYEDSSDKLLTALRAHITGLAYSTPLMLQGGSVEASFCETEGSERIISTFFAEQASTASTTTILAVGDGNHSLMSAKQVWLDSGADMESSKRWAMVELVNIFDKGLKVEPIHRVLFEVNIDAFKKVLSEYGSIREAKNATDIGQQKTATQEVKILLENTLYYWKSFYTSQLDIETIEEIIQKNTHLYKKIDFIHASSEVKSLIQNNANSVGLVFPAFEKASIFATVNNNKLFPRKSFSLGDSQDKKYYIETSKLT